MAQQSDAPPGSAVSSYLDRVTDRLQSSYDLTTERTVQGRSFDCYGHCRIEHRKSFLHPSITYANHDAFDHLFVECCDSVTTDRLDRLAELGHSIAPEWIDTSPDHYETSFTFALVVPEIPPSVETFVREYEDRTLLRYGFHGRYEIAFVVVAPGNERLVASPSAAVAAVFSFWEDDRNAERSGVVGRLKGLFD